MRGSALAAIVAGLAFGCAPAEEAPEVETSAAEATATGGGAASPTTAQEPACQFTVSGDELTGRASPPDSAMAEVGGTPAKICYGAPSMRDREVMGGLVPYGQPWRIGANEPTTLHLPMRAEIGSVAVEPGSYSLFAIPGEAEWTIVVNSNVDRWGIPINAAVRERDVGSFTVEPRSTEQPVETLRIEMSPLDGGAAEVSIAWETTEVSFPISP